MVSEDNKNHVRGHRIILTFSTAATNHFTRFFFFCFNCLRTEQVFKRPLSLHLLLRGRYNVPKGLRHHLI